MKYQEAYDKIIQAYFKDEIRPRDSKFCFCGTLAAGDGWICGDDTRYTKKDYVKMEHALLFAFGVERPYGWEKFYKVEDSGKYEETLFSGMCAALEVLKEIHRSRGENVDSPELTKRVLVKV